MVVVMLKNYIEMQYLYYQSKQDRTFHSLKSRACSLVLYSEYVFYKVS